MIMTLRVDNVNLKGDDKRQKSKRKSNHTGRTLWSGDNWPTDFGLWGQVVTNENRMQIMPPKYKILTHFCPGGEILFGFKCPEAGFRVVLPCKVVIVAPWTALFSNVADTCEIVAFKFFSKMQCFLSGGFGGSWCWRLSSVSKVLQSAPVKLRKCIKSTCTLRSWSGYCGTK